MKGKLEKPSKSSHVKSDSSGYNNTHTFELETVLSSTTDSSSTPENGPSNDEQPVPYFQLYRFSSTIDKWMIAIATLSALATGPCLAFIVIFFGDLVNSYIDEETNSTFTELRCNATNTSSATFVETSSDSTLNEDLLIFSINTGIAATVSVVLNFVFVTLFNISAENQVYRIRSRFLKAALKQDIAWYDQNTSDDFASRTTNNLNKIQEGIGEKVGMFVSFSSTAVSCIVTALVYGWELTLVSIAAMPLLTITMTILTKIQGSLSVKELQVYSEAGGRAEEALTAIRTVLVFGGQDKEISRFEESLLPAKKAGIKRGLATGISIGVSWMITYASYALAFWYGIQLVLNSCRSGTNYDAGILNIVFFNALYAALKFGQAFPLLESFAVAKGAACSIFQIIDRVPSIDSSSTAGLRPSSVQGDIRFENVHFSYPSRSDVPVLKGVTFSIAPGQTVALVGSSGCGKSTCIQLLQRFYDPSLGQLKIDGTDIKELNVQWLRDQIGVVGQEPVLFGTTIGENIKYGCSEATQEDVIEAAKLANAHGFIDQLPLKYETMVGERGAQLSGGQKQRIAIARALIANPKILLLDEATSALDTQSEAVVQQALDQASEGRTTVIVAHRLTTVRNADCIFVFKNGSVEECGTHAELMSRRGLYFSLVNSQSTEEETHQEDTIDEEVSVQSEDSEPSICQAQSVEVQPIDRDRTCDQDISEESVSLWRLLKVNRSEWPYLVLGSVGSAVAGLVIPVYAIVFGEVQGILSNVDEDQVRRRGNFLSLLFVAIAVAAGIGSFLQNFMFSLAGEHLTNRLRALSFRAMLRQEIGWFDLQENSVGALCARLSGDASSVQGATGARIGTTIQVTFALAFSIVVAFSSDWRLGLVSSVFVPVILFSAILEARIETGQNVKQIRALEKSSRVAMESILNIRTVASLGLEGKFHSIYMEALAKPHTAVKNRSPIRGLLFGMTINMVMFASIATYHYGGYLLQSEGLPYKEVLKVAEAMIFGMEMVGQTLAFTPNFGKAKAAANRIFQLLDRKPLMTSTPTAQRLSNVEGEVEFDDVHFTYPTRRDVSILNGLSLAVRPGHTVALVGPSGCGKSTCIQLLQRFYDPDRGVIRVDDFPIAPLDVSSLRSHLSIVSQEPMLFNRTIAENIAYGDNSRTVPMEEIIEAAKKANIHTFIQSLPLGYETKVGHRGTQLSGGQRQRVAIGRALVRNPRILLLDEATSALDSESEKIVQDALDQAQEERTCITIAHRLSTIQNADCIFVLNAGRVEEYGTHHELIQGQGLYHRLWTIQGSIVMEH
nr:ABCB1-2 protein [Diaphanosoma celebensis]